MSAALMPFFRPFWYSLSPLAKHTVMSRAATQPWGCHWFRCLLVAAVAVIFSFGASSAKPLRAAEPRFVDLSLLVAPDYPATWPAGFLPFEFVPYERIGKLSPYNSDLLLFDENTGTQFDAPTHSVAPPNSGLPTAGPFGTMSSEKVPAWQFAGEACVINVRDQATSGPKGRSDLISRDRVIRWEKDHRPLKFGDVALFRSDYSDRFYKPLPEGRRYLADPIEGVTSAWPDPSAECMEYLASRGVLEAGTDSPSMGPIPPPLGDETHYAGLRHGMIWTESATHLGHLPVTGAFYCLLSPKVVAGIGGAGRAFAIVGDPLAGRLIESAQKRQAVDLSVELTEDTPLWWPGRGVGRARNAYGKYLIQPFKQQRHLLDSNTGTHLVPPAYALPPAGFDNGQYSAEVQKWLAEFETKYGLRGTSDVTAEKVPIAQTCGPARVVDVRSLVGTTNGSTWPASPEITPDFLRDFEAKKGPLKPGEIVIFHSGHTDRFCKPFPEGKACMENPLNGKSEGWPALSPDAVVYLAEKGIRCVATDGPTLGGVDAKRALWTYWLLGNRDIVGVEYLKNVEKVPQNAFFLFAPLKIRDCHGGPGRALIFF
jgi:kynurenine formamidase